MAFVPPHDRVLDTSTSNSQTVFAISGSGLDTSYNTFSASMSVNDTTIGGVVEPGVAFVSGILTYSATNQVTVSTVKESKGTFSSSGTKQVFMGQPALVALMFDGPQTLTAAQKAQAQNNIAVPPTTQSLTSGSGATYTTGTQGGQRATWIEVFFVGAGGGGAGTNTTAASFVAGSAGGDTTFNSVVAKGGSGALGGATGGNGVGGGAGGTGGTGTATLRANGGKGGQSFSSASINVASGKGGDSYFAPGGEYILQTGTGAQAGNPGTQGSGGSGANNNNGTNFNNAGGAGAGEFCYLLILNPAATYTYTVGPGGAGGVSTTNGGAGGSGFIFVIEHYGS
jgi:hypothetical protein